MVQLKGKTCIVQFVDEMNLTNALLVDGKYETFNKNVSSQNRELRDTQWRLPGQPTT